jgi:hypothetical protein
MLGVDQGAIDDHVEDSAAAAFERRLRPESLFDSGSQTGRLGLIVSLHAVGDADFHAVRPLHCGVQVILNSREQIPIK